MKLSERLELVLSFVEPGESAADRTDHGHVPVELVRRAIVKKAVAMDVRKARYPGRRRILPWLDLRIRSRRDFLTVSAKLQPGEADSVVIAGMGGRADH
ncbi:MAG: SAM-dependent methyltransferase [Pilosibacter sp.]